MAGGLPRQNPAHKTPRRRAEERRPLEMVRDRRGRCRPAVRAMPLIAGCFPCEGPGRWGAEVQRASFIRWDGSWH